MIKNHSDYEIYQEWYFEFNDGVVVLIPQLHMFIWKVGALQDRGLYSLRDKSIIVEKEKIPQQVCFSLKYFYGPGYRVKKYETEKRNFRSQK